MLVLAFLPPLAAAAPPSYPATRRAPVEETLHGVVISDPYRWLEDGSSTEVQDWTRRQNEVARAALDGFTTLRAEMSARLEALSRAETESVPRMIERKYFFTRRGGQKNQPVLCMREGGVEKDARIVFDPNTLSADGVVALDWWYPSADGAWLAYGVSTNGDEWSTLKLRDVGGAAELALQIPRTRGGTVAWDRNGGGFLYTRYPRAGEVPAGDENYSRHVYYHKFGTRVADDEKVFGDGAPKEVLHAVFNSHDFTYQFVKAMVLGEREDVHFRKSGEREFKPLAVGLDALFRVDVLKDRLVILTNHGAPRYRVMTAEIAEPSPASWREVIPQQAGVIQDFAIVDGRLAISVLENVRSRLFVHDLDGTQQHEIALPTLGTVSELSARPDADELYFTFQSFVHPPTVYRFELEKQSLSVVHQPTLPIDPAVYATAQVWCTSKDGTRVPMFIVHKQDVSPGGDNPCVLYGYGGFNVSITPTFQANFFPWLDRGGVVAIANIRGGGEFGREWHFAGRGAKKQNSFDDMIAAAEKLIAERWTRPERLGARGGSNGGLLMGALMTQRPDLFRAIVCQVPLLDMLRYHRFSVARLWIPEYGSAEDPRQFETLLAYSPYQHVRESEKYPAVLLTTAESDSRVDPMHARKMAARLQPLATTERPVLLWTETKAGHGAGKPLSKQIETAVDYWTFFCWQLGVAGEAGAAGS